MQDKATIVSDIAIKYEAIIGCLSEKGRRLWAAAEALSYGRGGATLVCRATGLARSTIHRGIEEIQVTIHIPLPRLSHAENRGCGGGGCG
jgi:hypothetical protein